jgi:octaheme c-type cytochrome (tetrathionate reductase family)
MQVRKRVCTLQHHEATLVEVVASFNSRRTNAMRIPLKTISLLASSSLLTCAALPGAHPSRFIQYEDASTCMECHWSAIGSVRPVDLEEIMGGIHWTWETEDAFMGETTGKRHVINNYCVAVPSNEPRCTSCHIGIGWKDDSFDFTDASRIDCLVCHDGSGTYKKVPTGAGQPVAGLDYQVILASIQRPDRDNCGSCHFYGGGGDAVKHGSLDSTMAHPPRSVDVHMGSVETGGLNMQCTDCHVPERGTHTIVGSRYSRAGTDADMCRDCHTSQLAAGESLHGDNWFIDMHTDRVACQTCHIPAFARGGKATKMTWDWSTAGRKDEDGKNIATEDYNTMKGSFTWEGDVIPEYVWFNGNVRHVTLDDTFAADDLVTINALQGRRGDFGALIFPVKRFTAIQPYDAVYGNLAIPNLFPNPSPTADPDAYWVAYDWTRSIESGMAAVGRAFSGEVGFIASEMFWIQNHMVAPKEDALRCIDCHSSYGQLSFAALGYRPVHADSLQHLYQYLVWAGYEVQPNEWVNASDWLGQLHIWYAPEIYSRQLDQYLFIPEETVTLEGGWTYWFSTANWSVWRQVGASFWYYAPELDKYVYVPGGNLQAISGWAWVAA